MNLLRPYVIGSSYIVFAPYYYEYYIDNQKKL